MTHRSIDTLSIDDIRQTPVWRFVSSRKDGETALAPVRKLPCKDRNGIIVGTQFELADGTKVWAMVGNVDPTNSRLTEHFLTISIESNGRWFHLARYHDHDYEQRGPAALATFLERSVDSVYPLSFDLTGFVEGDHDSLRVTVPKEPNERLTRSEIIALAVP
jgi:hypothetical protein